MRICSVEGCDGKHYAKSYCIKHYRRNKRHGSADTVLQVHGDDDARFDSRVELIPETSCHWWTGTTINGYGQISIAGKHMLAHRYAYARAHGPIPKGEGYHGTVVMHTCDNPTCVNPEHLVAGTNADNMADKVAKGRQNRGDSSWNAKISSIDVIHIRSSNDKLADIATRYGVSKATVSRVRAHQTWKHIA